MTSLWTFDHVARIGQEPMPAAPVIAREEVPRLLEDMDFWDQWPVQEIDGRTAAVAGGELMMLLSAPAMPDIDARHDVARIRLMHHKDGRWMDLGPLLPDGFAPGSREWAGSAVIDPDHRFVTLYFTAAGHRGEEGPKFDQRLFETRGRLQVTDGRPGIVDWSEPVESVASDGAIYSRDMSGGGAIGTIKAFRDPAFFRDPSDGRHYLLFTASLGVSSSRWNGAVGVAERVDGNWRLRPPLIAADALNNELERPHLIARNGFYYLFWSTQAKVFAPESPPAPTGLYGMVANALEGPYRPLNGSGLVIANPPAAPFQAYSWLVLDDLRVLSFADLVGLPGPPACAEQARAHLGGAPAPVLRIALRGDRSELL
jgi:levansucrase